MAGRTVDRGATGVPACASPVPRKSRAGPFQQLAHPEKCTFSVNFKDSVNLSNFDFSSPFPRITSLVSGLSLFNL